MTAINSQQILIPRKVYIGDGAELTLSFNSTEEISGYNWAGDLNLKEYDIQDLIITKTGLNYYQISIRFVPWKTGQIKFPDLELIYAGKQGHNKQGQSSGQTSGQSSIEADSDSQPSADSHTILSIEPIQIVSLVEQNQVTGMRGPTNPMLIPGTAYKLYGTLIAGILILLLLIRLLIKRKHIAQLIKERKIKIKYKRNQKKTIRSLSELLKSDKKKDPKLTAEIIQKLMRNYLEVRFEYPFTKTVSSKIVEGFLTATSHMAENKKIKAIEEMAGIFIRTDYIRYGNGTFLDNELNEIIKNLKSHIETLEAAPPKIVDIH